MIRIKDAEKTIKFYQDNFGMKLVRTHESPESKFNLYFLGYVCVHPHNLDGSYLLSVLDITKPVQTQAAPPTHRYLKKAS